MKTGTRLTPLERLLNRWVDLSPGAGASLARLQGRRIRIALEGGSPAVLVSFLPEGIRVAATGDEDGSDAVLQGSTVSLLRAVLGGRGKPRPFESGISVTGDVAVVQDFRKLIADIDLDWEEGLSRVLGDPAAHGLGLSARRLGGWVRGTSHSFWLDLAEYVVEEKNMVPGPDEVTAFLEGVDEVRDGVDRLIARVGRLG